MKMQYTEEQIARANQTDLVSFLNEQGEQLVKSGREYRRKKHDSVTISGNRWYRHSQSKGGYPVDFVMEFYYATFPEAVKMLIGEEGEGRQKSCPAPSKDFRLPEKNKDNEMIVKYLTESRELEKNLVMEWIVRGDIYEEKKHHNVVFIGRDADVLIKLLDFATEERIISCLCLKQPLICSLLFSCFPKTGRNAAT